jgi:putative restriction endonuclease
MDDLDDRVRLAAFRFLETQVRLGSDDTSLRRDVLQRGFTYAGERVPLLGPQGIFKPRLLPEIPLSITTVPVVEGEERPYDDAFGADGLLRYRYRGKDPRHHENVGLRLALFREAGR